MSTFANMKKNRQSMMDTVRNAVEKSQSDTQSYQDDRFWFPERDKGGNGFAMEYGLSPFEWGICEKNVSRGYLREKAKEFYGEKLSPRIVEKYFNNNDERAIKIYNDYGNNLGIILSHIINMIDPNTITIGGGLSYAFDCFKNSMFATIKEK